MPRCLGRLQQASTARTNSKGYLEGDSEFFDIVHVLSTADPILSEH